MIKKEMATILSTETIAKDTIEMVLKNDYISTHAMPGQFVHVSIIGHTLRRPISIASVDETEKTFTLLFKIVGSGTERLAQYKVGETLNILGPNGNGFPIEKVQENDSVLLIGGGIGVPPIYFLAKQLKEKNVNVKAIIGFQSKDYLFYEAAFNNIAETIVVTDDGTYGKQGLVTNFIGDAGHFERYFTCGPLPMLKAVKDHLPNKEGYLSFEERMACGVGACYACVIRTNTPEKYKKICQSGPVFAASEVSL